MAGKKVSICGELAGDPAAAVLLIAMGFDSLSMNATNLPKVKSVIRQLTLVEARGLLADVLAMDQAEEIHRYLDAALETKGVTRLLLHSQHH
jgi:phosphotransferase system enzyme I (PtsP)